MMFTIFDRPSEHLQKVKNQIVIVTTTHRHWCSINDGSWQFKKSLDFGPSPPIMQQIVPENTAQDYN